MAPIKLLYADVVAKGREAYLARGLSAQGPTPRCAYRDESGRPCVIGAALTDDQAARLEGGISYLMEGGAVETDNYEGLARLQYLHDLWADRYDDNAEAALARLLGVEVNQ